MTPAEFQKLIDDEVIALASAVGSLKVREAAEKIAASLAEQYPDDYLAWQLDAADAHLRSIVADQLRKWRAHNARGKSVFGAQFDKRYMCDVENNWKRLADMTVEDVRFVCESRNKLAVAMRREAKAFMLIGQRMKPGVVVSQVLSEADVEAIFAEAGATK